MYGFVIFVAFVAIFLPMLVTYLSTLEFIERTTYYRETFDGCMRDAQSCDEFTNNVDFRRCFEGIITHMPSGFCESWVSFKTKNFTDFSVLNEMQPLTFSMVDYVVAGIVNATTFRALDQRVIYEYFDEPQTPVALDREELVKLLDINEEVVYERKAKLLETLNTNVTKDTPLTLGDIVRCLRFSQQRWTVSEHADKMTDHIPCLTLPLMADLLSQRTTDVAKTPNYLQVFLHFAVSQRLFGENTDAIKMLLADMEKKFNLNPLESKSKKEYMAM